MTTKCTITDLELERSSENGSFILKVADLELKANNAVQRRIPIMGSSGAGKSTLLNALASIAWQKKGTIQWSFPSSDHHFNWQGGKPLPNHHAHELRRRHFGFMFQNSSLLPYCSIIDNLIYPQMMIGKKHFEAEQKARDLLEKALPGRKNYENRFIHQISGGERQRVALMQALVNDPYVLFADEPVGSLDPTTRKTIMDLLYQWTNKEEHRLLLWVTHHEDDPKEAKVERYLYVDKTKNIGKCEWRQV